MTAWLWLVAEFVVVCGVLLTACVGLVEFTLDDDETTDDEGWGR